MLRGLFVTGTDTDVGKTMVSAALLHRYGKHLPLRYWKPIQTGTNEDNDTSSILNLTTSASVEILDEGIRLPSPVSPHLAASLAGQTIDLTKLIRTVEHYPKTDRWIIEGAGGLLVPINKSELIVDLLRQLNLPALVVSRSSLGTINHTLLTLEGLRSRSISVAGIVMVGELNPSNRNAIEKYGRVSVVAQMPSFDRLSEALLADWARDEMDPENQLWNWLK